jgi:choline dehydrogenase-like flavoprotein
VSALKVDAAVIGSGASGAVMAYELARKGLSVVVLERGPREDPHTFEHDELAMFGRVYKQGGLQLSDDHDSVFVQGSVVGGSTVINNAIWMRADLDRVLPEWEAAGAPVDRTDLEQAWEELEYALHVSQVPSRYANRATEMFLRGAEKAGVDGELLMNNRQGCIGCGWCNYGCRYDRKTSMLVTYIPWAEGRGAEVIDSCEDVRVLTNGGGRATGVSATRHGTRIRYDADRVVVCAGAIGSSAVLLASGIKAGGRVGQGLHALAGVFVTGETDEVVDGFDGIGLTAIAKASDDFVIESYFAPPVAFALRLGGWFMSHFDRAERYRHFIDGGVMVGTDPSTGSVRLDRKGRVRINFRASETDLDRLRRGLKQIAKIYFEAGARRVFPSTFKMIEFANPDDLDAVDRAVRQPDDLLLGSAHPQGGNLMNEDPRAGVVGPDFRVHDVEGLYVADTSVWPRNIWVNCQATAMGMAHVAASRVAA